VFHELELTEFADAFAQMLTYGLFLAKLNADTQTISLANAKEYIPKSFQLIRELVSFLDELDNDQYKETKWIIDETISIMNNIELAELKRQLSFTKRVKDSDDFETDPYIYFYETFLTAYDSKLRKAKGVYYTPPQVVNFITRAINDILKNVFNIPSGFAGRNNVTVLDFATGTGTFLLDVIKQTLENLPPDSKAKRDLIIKEHILKNFFGFEYLIAPYTIAHLKISQYLQENGYTFENNERLQIFLTNTLEPINAQLNYLLPQLSKEGELAQQVKERPILVVTGNPPYSYESKNNGDWITNLLKGNDIWAKNKKESIANYYMIDSKKLDERNPKGLQDDYVKFIRFAQHKMEQVEQGVIGIITNHAFLDNPTFRGMRQSLINTFDQMYFIDLHGNAKKKEKTLEGGKDENVFDIEQGVAISFFIKMKGLEKKVFQFDLRGEREAKYKYLLVNNFDDIDWKPVNFSSPFYLFTHRDEKDLFEYNSFHSVNEIFNLKSVGIVTSRDNFVISHSREELENRITNFIEKSDTRLLKVDDKLDVNKAITSLKKEDWRKKIYKCHYRPFDIRYILFDKSVVDRTRDNVMRNFRLGENLAILFRRQYKHGVYSYILVAESLVEARFMENAYSHVYVNPLYTYSEPSGLFADSADPNFISKAENFTKEFRNYINSKYSKTDKIYTPEQILGYIYAILYSPTYRSKYSEFLKTDFPRIPFAERAEEFETLSQLGYTLVQMHLLKQLPQGGNYLGMGAYKGDDDNVVNKPVFSAYPPPHNQGGIGRLYINAKQYFDNIPESVYNFHIGGYQVLDKYLKDRKTRTLTIDEIENVENVVKVLAFTIKQMEQIDTLTRDWI
jgi:predicted helicase